MDVPYLPGGGSGVYVFFALSGFLITTLLLQERETTGSVSLRGFYARRALRLFPALVAVVAVTAVYVAVGGAPSRFKGPTLASVPPALFYYANWEWFVHGDAFNTLSWFGHFWSLSVEEQFYLIWPVLLLLLYRRGSRRRVVVVLALACVVPLLVRLVTIHGLSTAHLKFGTHAVADSLALGGMLSVALRWRPDHTAALARVTAWPAVAVLLVAVPLSDPSSQGWRGVASNTVAISVISVASVAVIGHVVTAEGALLARLLSSRALVYLGRISYGMYLWHIIVLVVLQQHLHVRHGVELYLAGYTGTVAVASASFFFVERKFLRLKARFERDPAGRQRSAAEAMAAPAG
jgi:peptidoglycan/LPS O-acetylase OafA/YrhL